MTITEQDDHPALSPRQDFLGEAQEELARVKAQLNEIRLLVEQSQGEVEKLAERNTDVTSRLHQLQASFDTVPREDIRATYEAAQDAQRRLFTMRGQLEKLESDQANLSRYVAFLQKTLRIVDSLPDDQASKGRGPELEVLQKVIEAQEEERRKISRQIHDGPAQTLSNFILQAEIAMRLFENSPEDAREELANLKQAAATSFSRIRDFIFELRPMMLDDLGLVPTMRRYTEAFASKSGMEINLVSTGSERRLESHLEVLLFRAIQDILANVREHAQATQAKVMIDMGESHVRVMVEDNGKGIDPSGAGTSDQASARSRSLDILKERITQVGGSFQISSKPNEGTQVTLSVPSGG